MDVEAIIEAPYKNGGGNDEIISKSSSKVSSKSSPNHPNTSADSPSREVLTSPRSETDRGLSRRNPSPSRSSHSSTGSRRERSRHRQQRDEDRDRDRDRAPSNDRSSERSSNSRRRRERERYSREDDDYYRHRRRRSRSRTPSRRSRYREEDDEERRYSSRSYKERPRRRTPSPPPPKSPVLTEEERDRRTVFVQQLAARLRSRELEKFFEQAGPVREAQIVRDRISNRSKGIGYVEFRDEDSVPKALELTGQKLLGIPVIVELTEAEKNRQAKANAASTGGVSAQANAPFHRLYVGNIHFNINENDIRQIFEPFGQLEFVQLQRDPTGRSKGYGFLQFVDPNMAKEALAKMNGFDLAGRPIRVGLGNERINQQVPGSTATAAAAVAASSDTATNGFQGSGFDSKSSTSTHTGGTGERRVGVASQLDDSDIAGVSYSSVSRESLMKKLMRQEDSELIPQTEGKNGSSSNAATGSATPQQQPPSRCILLRNMFDPKEETGDSWVKELEEDVKTECNEKYGKVVHIAVESNSVGEIYVKFENVTGGERAIQGLNGRFFGGRQISASPVIEMVYTLKYPKSKNT